jgi:hypothetical protein
MHRNRSHLYSITLSALASSVAGTVSPSAFACGHGSIARDQMQVPSIKCSCVQKRALEGSVSAFEYAAGARAIREPTG